MKEDISIFLSGKKLYGDNFTQKEIEEWFADEKEGYAGLCSNKLSKNAYEYHELNMLHGFKYINKLSFDQALGIGSAFGYEFEPIANKIKKISILDPSEKFSVNKEINGVPCEYIKPNYDGNMPFDDKQFDLITCFGVLHHIPNVSYVMKECFRCLNIGGYMLLREPIISMGDWRKPRVGLTKRERGIPKNILVDIIDKTGFQIKYESFCIFPPLFKIASKLGYNAYNNRTITMVDKSLSKLFSWNIKYHRTKIYEKFAPVSKFFVVQK